MKNCQKREVRNLVSVYAGTQIEGQKSNSRVVRVHNRDSKWSGRYRMSACGPDACSIL
jgi:hypothetical protein